MTSYDPGTSPFELPLAIYAVEFLLKGKFPQRELAGATPATSFRGALLSGVWRSVCAGREAGEQPCPIPTDGGKGEGEGCRRPGICAARGLCRPRSEAQKRDHPPPLILWLDSIEPEQNGRTRFRGSFVTLGRRALRSEALIRRGVMEAAHAGLHARGRSVPFEVRMDQVFEGSMAQWVRRTELPALPTSILIEFSEPCDSTARNLGELLGDSAHDLVQWDLEDRGMAGALGKRGCDALADAARSEAASAVSTLVPRSGVLESVDLGLRRSGSTSGKFPLGGFRGYASFEGNIAPALPWLEALALRGAGGRKSFGLGRVKLWYPR